MNPSTIIQKASEDGVNIVLSDSGTIKAIGDKDAVNRWLPAIRDHKPEIVKTLQHHSRTATPAEAEELSTLIREVYIDWEPEDRQLAIKVAIADVENALICFRDLWDRMRSGEMHPYMKDKGHA